jgi:hypothetical protein
MRITDTAETAVVALALAGATTAKFMTMIDTSTTVGVLASLGCGVLTSGIMMTVGIATTIYYRRATKP